MESDMKKYLHVGFWFEGKPLDNSKLIDIFDEADDWLRYAPSCWILFTDKNQEYLVDKIRNIEKHNHSLLIFEVTFKNRQGWLTDEVWEWLAKKRDFE
jgi:hypothetical protein